MYKVHINHSLLVLGETSTLLELVDHYPSFQVIQYQDSGQLEQLILQIEAHEEGGIYCLLHSNLEELINLFAEHYSLHPAAGGIVFNERKEYLFIFRRGMWDLPKGHIDPGEDSETAALREIEEETGLSNIILGRPIVINDLQANATYHTYYTKKGKRVLKQTFWYEVFLKGEQDTIPQTEEDIEKVEWGKADDLSHFLENTFESIREVVEAYGQMDKIAV